MNNKIHRVHLRLIRAPTISRPRKNSPPRRKHGAVSWLLLDPPGQGTIRNKKSNNRYKDITHAEYSRDTTLINNPFSAWPVAITHRLGSQKFLRAKNLHRCCPPRLMTAATDRNGHTLLLETASELRGDIVSKEYNESRLDPSNY